MKLPRIIGCLLTVVLFTKCGLIGSCDEMIYKGSIELDEQSIDKYPPRYLTSSTVRYFNESGDIKRYSFLNQRTEYRLEEQVDVCEFEPHDPIYHYYDTEEMSTKFIGSSDVPLLSLSTVIFDSKLYDVLHIQHANADLIFSRITIIASLRENANTPFGLGRLDSFHQELELRGRFFSNVILASKLLIDKLNLGNDGFQPKEIGAMELRGKKEPVTLFTV